ncbi:MAG: glutathione S-transferase family protein [Gammaproteobacteria bacterium]|nr:MAG: glutathione S-transferase family protein [Gammaproteobacteria bacterium]
MITLYGISASRAFRCLWMLEEVGLPYRHEPLDYRDKAGLDDPSYRALNPNGRIPTLVDGDHVLWESMAINLYLARKYGGDAGLWPDSPETEGLAWQWSFWVMTEVEHALLTVLMHRRVLPEAKRDPERATRNEGLLRQPLRVLDQALGDRDYLVDGRFTVADLNVAAVVSWAKPARYPLKEYPALSAWLNCCLSRPARKRAQTR